MTSARNDDELAAMLEEPFRKAAEYIANQLYELNKEAVELAVYDTYVPMFYERTGEFAEAWETKVESSSGKATAKLEYAPSKMSVGGTDMDMPNYGQHVSAQSGADVRAGLADIIYQGLAGPTFGWANGGMSGKFHQSRNGYKRLKQLLGKQRIKNIVKDGLVAAGFTVKGRGVVSVFEDE